MTYTIVGLGNTGDEYENSRHNTGRILVESFSKSHRMSPWQDSHNKRALVSTGKVGKESVTLVLPETMMNKSGIAIKEIVTSTKKAEKLIVVYDEIDLPLGKVKLSFGRSSGGHRGVESIIKNVHTKNFIRVRVGISPSTKAGKIKKPIGEDAVIDFILGAFKKKELEELGAISVRVGEALERIIKDGYMRAVSKGV